ncbi:hypothetical protein BDK51DRAFT_40584 [Blyttiomyces helicus]|uniref:Uncharacterized protein n=1 Tax=Blyttiomyces helicus TaxID=388810 RepID=A0A4P9WKY7_9FUNG|nr:hypothetical protein BDK51DRAFT_40584 [Blyttiomyces helicus]|eukprot:RKO93679.1 hypothetical protein BDK51DRAFT_40584 [Blyttiomyces helicus]
MEALVTRILTAHGLVQEFTDAGHSGKLWTVEISPRESAGFSLPLVLAREGSEFTLAQYSIGEWDVNYDPILVFAVGSASAPPALKLSLQSVYRFHSGLRELTADSAGELEGYAVGKLRELVERGYCDPAVAFVKRFNAKL